MIIEVEIKSYPIVAAFHSPAKWKRRLRFHYARAGLIVGRVTAAMMRHKIRGGMSPANAPMTTAMKGSSKPLVDRFQMGRAITHRIGGEDNNEVAIGVMRTNARANVAVIVTKGATITVTKRMATLFRVLNAASQGKPWAKVTSKRGQDLLAQSKGVIPVLREGSTLRIPPRDFVAEVAADPALKSTILREYKKAIERTLNDMRAGGPSA